MTWREELRGVRRIDLACAALLVPVTIWAAVTIAQDAQETPVQETQVQETQVRGSADEYKAVWEWCGVRFPFRDDLQEACRWGAYEMLPGQEVPADEGIRNVMDRS
jgi:hypothetical protein